MAVILACDEGVGGGGVGGGGGGGGGAAEAWDREET